MARICAENPSKEVKEMGLTADQKNATVFTVKVDDCRTQNWTCVVVVDEVANKEVMYEPDFGDDPMFPTVGHLLTIQIKKVMKSFRTRSRRTSGQVEQSSCT